MGLTRISNADNIAIQADFVAADHAAGHVFADFGDVGLGQGAGVEVGGVGVDADAAPGGTAAQTGINGNAVDAQLLEGDAGLADGVVRILG